MVDAHLAPGGACNLADIRTAAETTLGGLESLADNIGAAEASKRFGEAKLQIGRTSIVPSTRETGTPATP